MNRGRAIHNPAEPETRTGGARNLSFLQIDVLRWPICKKGAGSSQTGKRFQPDRPGSRARNAAGFRAGGSSKAWPTTASPDQRARHAEIFFTD